MKLCRGSEAGCWQWCVAVVQTLTAVADRWRSHVCTLASMCQWLQISDDNVAAIRSAHICTRLVVHTGTEEWPFAVVLETVGRDWLRAWQQPSCLHFGLEAEESTRRPITVKPEPLKKHLWRLIYLPLGGGLGREGWRRYPRGVQHLKTDTQKGMSKQTECDDATYGGVFIFSFMPWDWCCKLCFAVLADRQIYSVWCISVTWRCSRLIRLLMCEIISTSFGPEEWWCFCVTLFSHSKWCSKVLKPAWSWESVDFSWEERNVPLD